MALLDTVRGNALSRGVLGNSRFWLVVGGVAWGIRAISWARRPHEKTIFREAILPGQTLLISSSGPAPSRRALKAARTAERQLDRRERRSKLATARARHRHRVL